MDRAELARARHRLWGLLGRIVADGVDGSIEPHVRALPALAPHLVADPDERAAEHHRVFSWEVQPFESLFRDVRPEELQATYVSGGFRPGRTDLPPDHLGLQLAFLSHLAAAEDEDLQQAFLKAHLLRWLPQLVVAVRRVSGGLEATACELALELAVSLVDDAGPAIATLDDPLDDPDTGVARIARHLCAPARSGWFLGQSAIAAIAKTAGVPSGFDGRARRLESVLFAAVDHGCLEQLVEALGAECARWRSELEALGELGADVSEPLARLDATRALLERLAARH